MSAQENRGGIAALFCGAGTALSACRCVWNQSLEGQAQERALEEQADAMLRGAEPNPQYPAYTELQLERHGEGKRLPLNDAYLENVTAVPTRENALAEIEFLALGAALDGVERLVLLDWLRGDTQEEIGRRFCPPLAQQQVSRLLGSAIRKCCESGALPFSAFSRHTIYRRPSRRRHAERGKLCARCGDWFPYGLGAGRYCSERCRGTGRR